MKPGTAAAGKADGPGASVRRPLVEGKTAAVAAVCVSEKKGEQKHAVDSVLLRPHHGIVGDAHAGDWHRQVSLLSADSVRRMQERVSVPLGPGVFAENILCDGLDMSAVTVGTVLSIGRAVCRVTQIGKECHSDCAIRRQAGDCVMPREGVFAEVLREGEVRPGDPISII